MLCVCCEFQCEKQQIQKEARIEVWSHCHKWSVRESQVSSKQAITRRTGVYGHSAKHINMRMGKIDFFRWIRWLNPLGESIPCCQPARAALLEVMHNNQGSKGSPRISHSPCRWDKVVLATGIPVSLIDMPSKLFVVMGVGNWALLGGYVWITHY